MKKPPSRATISQFVQSWCSGRDLNPHDLLGHDILSVACLPIPPPEQGLISYCDRDESAGDYDNLDKEFASSLADCLHGRH